MKGYFRHPEKTAEIMKDDWLCTGDLGYLDKEGYLFISGRKRNLIVLGAGKKVFPEEVEEVLGKSPLIKDICVLGRTATKGLRKGSEEVFVGDVAHASRIDVGRFFDKAVWCGHDCLARGGGWLRRDYTRAPRECQRWKDCFCTA